MKPKISEVEDRTMVWYLSEQGAVVVDVFIGWSGWTIRQNKREMIGFESKAQAISEAKKWLRKHYSEVRTT